MHVFTYLGTYIHACMHCGMCRTAPAPIVVKDVTNTPERRNAPGVGTPKAGAAPKVHVCMSYVCTYVCVEPCDTLRGGNRRFKV